MPRGNTGFFKECVYKVVVCIDSETIRKKRETLEASKRDVVKLETYIEQLKEYISDAEKELRELGATIKTMSAILEKNPRHIFEWVEFRKGMIYKAHEENGVKMLEQYKKLYGVNEQHLKNSREKLIKITKEVDELRADIASIEAFLRSANLSLKITTLPAARCA